MLVGQAGPIPAPITWGKSSMSTPSNPFDAAQPQEPTGASADASTPVEPQQPGTRGGRGRTVALVGGILAIVAVGAGGAFAFSQLSGGGAQPESVFPSTTLAFAKVDLDPSAGQKVDAIRFLRKFPDARDKVKEDSDLRKVVFDAIKEDGGLDGVDYAKDVEPWLGERAAIGAVAGRSGEEPVPVVALAVKDKGAAEKSLPKVAAAMDDGECKVVEEFAVCTEKDQLSGVVSAVDKATLADSANFKTDMGDLGESGIVTAWMDTAKLAESVKDLTPSGMSIFGATGKGAEQAGRVAMALRFDGPHLELAGHVNDAKTAFVGSAKAGSIAKLPKGTLAAVTVANAGEQLKSSWPQVESSLKEAIGAQEFADGVAQVEAELGISVPDDVVKALGSQLSIAFGGLGEDRSELKIGLVTDGDKDVLAKLTDAAGQGMGAGQLSLKSADGANVVSLSDTWADELTGDHGLGSTQGFKDAVKDADKARFAGYVDIAGLVDAFSDELPQDAATNLGGLSALGFTVSGEDRSGDFALRLTTK